VVVVRAVVACVVVGVEAAAWEVVAKAAVRVAVELAEASEAVVTVAETAADTRRVL